MIDVALTGLYDVCLFNSAAQVVFVSSGHGHPSGGLCAFNSDDDLNFLRNVVVLNTISKRYM